MKVIGQSLIGARLVGVLCPTVVAALAATPATVSPQFDIPPVAAEVAGPIAQIELSPVFAQRYVCVEHALELTHAGDALGTDCQVTSAVEIGSNGFSKLYRSDGKTNADWYGWQVNVLAPFDGKVVYVFQNSEENVPGVLGSTPAGTLRFENAAGVIVNYGHVAGVTVKVNDTVRAGQVVARVGNNGSSRAPHIHIGAYRKQDAVPLQIRWNLRAMAEARTRAGVK